MTMYAVFDDEAKTAIAGLYDCPQPTDWAPYQDTVTVTDPRYKAFYDGLLPVVQAQLPTPESTS